MSTVKRSTHETYGEWEAIVYGGRRGEDIVSGFEINIEPEMSPLTIGSSSDCDICIDSSELAPVHAYVILENEKLFVCAAKDNCIYLVPEAAKGKPPIPQPAKKIPVTDDCLIYIADVPLGFEKVVCSFTINPDILSFPKNSL